MSLNCITELQGEGTENLQRILCENLCDPVQLRDIAFLFSTNNPEYDEKTYL